MLDVYLEGDARFNPERSAPCVTVLNERSQLGGAANVAACAIKLGCEVTLFGVTGDDAAADKIADLCDQMGILLFRQVAYDRPTTTKLRVMESNLGYMFRLDNESRTEVPEDVRGKMMRLIARRPYDAAIIADYDKGIFPWPTLVEDLISRNVPSVADARSRGWVRGSCVMKANAREILHLGGSDDVETSALRVSERHGAGVLVTRGGDGASYYRAEVVGEPIREHWELDFGDADVIVRPDVQGAGDAVLAALGACVAVGSDRDEAVFTGLAAGTAACRHPGTHAPVPADIEYEMQHVVKK